MYESFYGFKEKPFQISPDPNFLYLSPNHNHALQYLEYGIERNIGIILLTGEVGSGKTTLIQYHRRQLGRDLETAVISNTNLSADDLIASVLIELNIQPDAGSKAINTNLFKAYLESLAAESRRLVLVIDEAQNLPREALEEIRMLSNLQADKGLPLQIFLIGQPELRTILKSPGMHQLRQRIAVTTTSTGSTGMTPRNTSSTGCRKPVAPKTSLTPRPSISSFRKPPASPAPSTSCAIRPCSTALPKKWRPSTPRSSTAF